MDEICQSWGLLTLLEHFSPCCLPSHPFPPPGCLTVSLSGSPTLASGDWQWVLKISTKSHRGVALTCVLTNWAWLLFWASCFSLLSTAAAGKLLPILQAWALSLCLASSGDCLWWDQGPNFCSSPIHCLFWMWKIWDLGGQTGVGKPLMALVRFDSCLFARPSGCGLDALLVSGPWQWWWWCRWWEAAAAAGLCA